MDIDEGSIRNIPGVRVIRRRDFVGVVASGEWDAIRAAQKLKVTWGTTASLPGNVGLYEKMRTEKTTDTIALERGDVASALGRAAHVVSKSYLCPYQSHAPFGPNCALADVKPGAFVGITGMPQADGTQRAVVDRMQMREELYEILNYHAAEQQFDRTQKP